MAPRINFIFVTFLFFVNFSLQTSKTQAPPPCSDTTCSSLKQKFSQATSQFIMCSIDKSKPVTFCQDCIDHYLDTVESYHNMSQVQVNGTSCIDNFVNLDRLEIVKKQYKSVHKLWRDAKCPACFQIENGTQTKNLSENATTFKKYYKSYVNCKEQSAENDICNKCMKDYVNLDTFYRRISNENELIGTCMDLVDKMNTSWTYWGAKCCSFRRHNETGFHLFTSTVLLATVLFYLLAQCYTKQKTASIIQQTRFPAFLNSTSINN